MDASISSTGTIASPPPRAAGPARKIDWLANPRPPLPRRSFHKAQLYRRRSTHSIRATRTSSWCSHEGGELRPDDDSQLLQLRHLGHERGGPGSAHGVAGLDGVEQIRFAL